MSAISAIFLGKWTLIGQPENHLYNTAYVERRITTEKKVETTALGMFSYSLLIYSLPRSHGHGQSNELAASSHLAVNPGGWSPHNGES